MIRPNRILFIFLVLSLIFSCGCIKRNLHIKSSPPGATVYFNEKDIGVTPLDFDFLYYATHSIKLEKDGYKAYNGLVEINSPLYMWIPLDFFLEILPTTFDDERELSYTLTQ